MKTTIDLPDVLFRRAKATAAVRGVSLKSFITRAVEQSLEGAGSSWSEVLAKLPILPADTLNSVRDRVAEADTIDLDFQRRPHS